MTITKSQNATTKRITKVTIKRMYDESPDTSWLGEYSDHPATEFAIDRAHTVDCEYFKTDHSEDCECNGGDMGRNELRYFNPATIEPYNPEAGWLAKELPGDRWTAWRVAMHKNALQDYNRMESLQRGDFCFIGVRAEAQVHLTGDLFQEITSGGLWGIESDSEESCFAEIEQEQLSELRTELEAMGFSKRAVSAAFKTIERKSL